MGRESISDPIVIQSSIALLQERFRQLQRMKEMREERELLRKKLAEPKQCNPTLPYDQPSGLLFFHFLPPRSPPRQVPNFSHCPGGSQTKCPTFGYMEAPLFASLLPTVTETTPPSLHVPLNKKLEDFDSDDDVDTSLHL
ncbi:hypothetical protein DITRI_Ditri19aG0005200 [Diplodiscus trichospermus]